MPVPAALKPIIGSLILLSHNFLNFWASSIFLQNFDGIGAMILFFKNQFIMPVEGIISGVYGSQRILNGKPKWPHYGIDIAAKKGTMIKSSGSGTVTMAEDDLYYTGGTIIMDHGHGISTIYSHLENVLVSVGDKINQGDIIGTVGSTGRSTGPHLDFRINWFQTRLDPMSVLK